MLKRFHFTDINVDAMRGNDLCFEQSLLFDVRHDGHALFVTHVFHFESGLGNLATEDLVYMLKRSGFETGSSACRWSATVP